jgi:hypothetical protein
MAKKLLYSTDRIAYLRACCGGKLGLDVRPYPCKCPIEISTLFSAPFRTESFLAQKIYGHTFFKGKPFV